MPPKQLNIFYFFCICVFLLSARAEADRQVFKIQFLLMLISQHYVQLAVRGLFWLSSSPSGSQHPAATCCVTPAGCKFSRAMCSRQRTGRGGCEDGAGQREKQQPRGKRKGCRGSSNILVGLFFKLNKC